jgi:amino acid adenylation domain-containing protein
VRDGQETEGGGAMVICPTPVSGFEEFPSAEREGSIPCRFESQVARYAERIAIEHGGQSWTYKNLNEAANRVAREILRIQTSDNNPVTLLFSPGFNAIAGILAVLKAGRAWVPMMPGEPLKRLLLLSAEAGSSVTLTDASHRREARAVARNHSEVLEIECAIVSGAADNLALDVKPDALSNLIFTSGSTGRPKGVMHTHRIILNNIMVHTNSLYLTHKDRICQVGSYTTLAGTSSIFRALLNGATLLPFNIAAEGAANLAHWLIERGITVCQIVPTLFRLLIQSLPEQVTFPDMRILHLGGEPVYRKDVLDFRRLFPKTCCLVHNLGSSEAPTIRQFFVDHDSAVEEERVPVGYPIPDREVTITDDAGEPVGFDEIGEIVVCSRYLAKGYWRQPELTRLVFEPDPSDDGMRRFHTGDLGSVSRDSCLRVHGRKDSQVKVHGYRVEVLEVEAILLSIDGIEQAAVSVLSETDSQRLVAFVVLRAGQNLTEDSIYNHLREKLASFMVPGQVVILPAFPLMANGKVDRLALRARAKRSASPETEEPANPLEWEICKIWSEVLRRPVGRTDKFLELGGDSLSGSQILARIAQRFGVRVTFKDLLERSTIAALAEWLGSIVNVI